MKEKLKKILKNRLFIFIITALLFSVVGVSAATYFESGAVTYDNTESGLTSTNVQGAIDELYGVCTAKPPAGGDGILESVPVVTSGDGLYKDEYEDGRYIFKGANPNNYITFNDEPSGWRIISIEPDKTIKIMKINYSIGSYKWHTSKTNIWQNARINEILNDDYYNDSLTSKAKTQISVGNFSIGAVTENNNDLGAQIVAENSRIWEGNIALITVSEYIRTNSNKTNCGTFMLMNNNYGSCRTTTWINNISYYSGMWTLTAISSRNDVVFYVNEYRRIISNYTDNNYYTYPVLYLSSEVQIKSGTGTYGDPYTLE